MALDWCERSSCTAPHSKKDVKMWPPEAKYFSIFYSRTRIVAPRLHLKFRTKKEMMYLIERNDRNFQTVYSYSSEEG